MKIKSILIAFLISLFLIPTAFAKSNVTGEAYNDLISKMSMSGVSIPGVTIDDLNASPAENCDNTAQLCLLKGFSWSNVVGWTSWDGKAIQDAVGGAVNFPDEFKAMAMFNGNMGGFIWGEKFGWIQLSSCSNLTTQTDCETKNYCAWTNNYCVIGKDNRVPKVASQGIDDWGAYVDFCPQRKTLAECESPESDQYCNWSTDDNVCVFDGPNNPNGQPLRGYAWSQYLGWIKLGPEAGETDFAGAFTKWYPDLTPPVFRVTLPDDAWMRNQSASGTLSWAKFASEHDSLIDLINSSIKVVTDTTTLDTGGQPAFTGCPPAPALANGNLIMDQNGFGEINLTMPILGKFLAPPPYGFCKYTLSGVIYNGSDFGYFFGPEGLAKGAAKGLDFTNPDPLTYAPNVYNPDSVTLYVRAGDVYRPNSALSFTGNNKVADGNNAVSLTFSPMDIGGNAITSVETALVPASLPETDQTKWVRNVSNMYDYDKSSAYYFDSIFVPRNTILGNPSPVSIGGNIFGFGSPLQYTPVDPPISGSYRYDVIGYAPTTASAPNPLHLDAINVTATDLTLPAISPKQPAVPGGTFVTTLDSSNQGTGEPLPFAYLFTPALEVTAGSLNADYIVLGQSVDASFSLRNNSSDALTSYSLDNILKFQDTGGIGQEVLEIKGIKLDGLTGSTDRTDPKWDATRYDLTHNAGGQDINEFHDLTQNFHDPFYPFNSTVDTEGNYSVDGKYYVAPTDPCLITPPCPPVNIDRTDTLSSDLAANGGIGNFSFGFMPSQFVGQAINAKVTFSIDQYLAYHSKNNPFAQYALYPAVRRIDGVDVKSIGLGTSGVVSGGQIYETISGRQLQTVSTASSEGLRKDIRKNVASLTRNMTPCELNPSSPTILSTLPTDPSLTSCLSVDSKNNTIIAYYSGPGTLQIGNGSNVAVPNDKYSIILTNGANLYIDSNVDYGSTDDSLGLIVLQDGNGKGGNVFINPVPTNLVGLLYAEGSILSSPDGGTTFYYGSAGGDTKDLKNQLYWQGSIASRNTIGGAPNKTVPDGVDCTLWQKNISDCSQAYDLDYVRRFTTKHDDVQNIDYSLAGVLFSGGGRCVPVNVPVQPNCSLGALPTTVKIMTGNSIDTSAPPAGSKSLDAFFIERDNRPVPPGFTSGGGLTSTSEIR